MAIDPVAFTIPWLNVTVYWYGIFVVSGILAAAWITSLEVKRRGGKPEHVWDGLTYAMIGGIIGARLWYVANDILGGNPRYLEQPLRIINIKEGGLHFYGGILFGALAVYWYARQQGVDMWLIADSTAPSLLIGQAIARPANYINQELYGPPMDLPWGIRIDQYHRIPPWTDLSRYPVETTYFHPTFAYEMIWNFLAGGALLWIARRYEEKLKPGTILAGWFVLAGIGRVIIETWRPDQPRIPGTAISWTRLVSALMALLGTLWLLVRYDVIHLPSVTLGPERYYLPATDEADEVDEAEESQETDA